jgi:hypothetical protein
MSETLEKTTVGPGSTPPRKPLPKPPNIEERNTWVRAKLKVEVGRPRSGVISDGGGGGGLPERPEALAKANVLTEAAQNQKVANAQSLAGLPAGDGADAIREILAQHVKAVPQEMRAFKGIDFLDDTTRIRNPDERSKRLQEMSTVLDAVKARRTALADAIKTVAATNPQGEAAAAALTEARQQLSTIDLHLPDEFQGLSGADIQRRISSLLATPDQKAATLKEAKSGFKDDAGNDISASFGEAFKGTIEPASAKSFERQRFYFDEFVSSPPPEKLKAIADPTTKISDQGQRILDSGGTLKDVEELMAKTGIPKDWWPPKLIDTLQAWRKTERAMMRERMAEQFKALPDLDTTSDTIESIKTYGTLFCQTLPKTAADQTDAILKNPEVAESIKSFLEGMGEGWGLGQVGLTALQMLAPDTIEKNDRGKLLDGIEKGLTAIESAIEAATAGVELAEKCGADILSSVVPGLSLAKCGVKLALAIKTLGEHTAILVETKMMKKDGRKALGNASMEDGGAFLNLLENELHGRKKQVAKDSIKVGTASMDLAGAAAGTFGGHYGLAAQGGLKIVSGTITVGTSVAFTNIDWAEAKAAKKIMAEARAGNPVARMEIFKNHNTYAKMCLCVLAQDGNPLAEKFIVQRGIEEDDLNDAMSMKILREALLDSAGQKAEEDVPDSLLLANTGKLGDLSVKFAKKIASAGESIKGALKDRKIAYDPAWVPQGPVVLTEKDYDATKAAAVKAGLFDEATGIGDALKDAAKYMETANEMIADADGKTMKPDSKEAKTLQKQLLSTIAAVGAAQQAVFSYTPITNPKDKKTEAHKGMAIYCGMLLDELRAQYRTYQQALVDLGVKNPNWQPAISSGGSLDAATWETNWKNGIVQACLPKDDGGMGSALKKVASAETAFAKAEKKPQERRTAALKLSDALNDLIGAAKDCRPQTAEAPAMADYLQNALNDAAARQREIDSELGAATWRRAVPPPETISASDWSSMWDEAVRLGCVAKDAGDGGMLKALQEMEKRKGDVDGALSDGGKKLLKARQDYALAAGSVLLAQQKFLTVQRDVAEPLKQAVGNAYKRAMSQQQAYDDARGTVNFTVTGGLGAKDWEATYKDAVDKGAVPAAKSAAKALSEALNKYESALADMKKAQASKKFESALKDAKEAEKQIDAAVSAIDSKLMYADGYADNTRMNTYLTTMMRPKILELKTLPPLSDVLGGKAAGDDFKARNFTWNPKDFSATKRGAIELGVIQDQVTGMSGALEERAEADAALVKAKSKKPPVAEDVKKATAAALASAVKLGRLSQALEKLSTNPNWVAYAKSAQGEIVKYIKTLT